MDFVLHLLYCLSNMNPKYFRFSLKFIEIDDSFPCIRSHAQRSHVDYHLLNDGSGDELLPDDHIFKRLVWEMLKKARAHEPRVFSKSIRCNSKSSYRVSSVDRVSRLGDLRYLSGLLHPHQPVADHRMICYGHS